jgi:hypothetical protein
MLALAPASSWAQAEDITERWSVEFDAGFHDDYDDSGLWGGGYDVGVTGLWSHSASTSFSARFGLSHWSYNSGHVVDALLPEGEELTEERSAGQVQALALVPMARYQREDVLGKLGAFVEGGVGIVYVKTFALTEVLYDAGTKLNTFEIDESDVGAEVRFCMGVSRAVSTSSWLDFFPSYRGIFTEETAHVLGFAFGFRVRV